MLFRRHLQLVIRLENSLNQQAVLGVAGDDGRPAIAALEQAIAVVDAQPALGVGAGRMAVVAVVDQERPDFFLEELDRIPRRSDDSGRPGAAATSATASATSNT